MQNELRHQSVQHFLDQLASGTATPGGGSVAALSGALAAGLVTMVCDLTIGRPRYAAFESEAQAIRQQAEAIRAQLTDLIQADIAAYTEVANAYKLPKEDPQRPQAISDALVTATDVPLRIAEQAATLLPLCLPLAAHGNRTAVGDVVAGAHLAVATVGAALVNVTANIGAIASHPRAAEFLHRQQTVQAGIEAQRDAAVATAIARM
ncbi:MAG: formiminotransferase-cyclodeaminase [Chloroflexia bacterium]|nr:formiminotransferase-cyclodeaminase [Chloroflexia bacterium]